MSFLIFLGVAGGAKFNINASRTPQTAPNTRHALATPLLATRLTFLNAGSMDDHNPFFEVVKNDPLLLDVEAGPAECHRQRRPTLALVSYGAADRVV